MAVVQTLIGNIKGPQGNTGATGATGDPGQAATVTVGSTTTTAYGNAASVTNSGTSSAAVFDFVIPQGKPGEATTKMGDLLLDSITSSAADFPSPQVGDTRKTAFGKINKFFSDVLSMFTKHESDIATISASPTTRAFTAGQYLVYNSQLYRVTANIANGGTLTVGTNITAVSAGGELTTINTAITLNDKTSSVTAGTNVTINSLWHFHFNGIAWVAGNITTSASLASTAAVLIGLEHTPISTSIPFPITSPSGNVCGTANVRNSGELHFGATTPAGTYIFNAMYKMSS